MLSTHIVEDVADLCPQIAIMNLGQIVNSGIPRSLIAQLQGKIWTKIFKPQDELPTNWTVITSRMRQGAKWIRVLSDYAPDGSFESSEPDLYDFYFTSMLVREKTRAIAT